MNANTGSVLPTKEQITERDLLSKEQLADFDHYLLDKFELAPHLGVTVRGVEMLVKERKIPVLRIGHKTLRFSLPRVLAALQKFEQKEVG